MRKWKFALVVLVVLLLSWYYCSTHFTTMKPLSVDPEKLMLGCEQLADGGIKQKKDVWLAGEPMPEVIKSLSPQVVRMQISESPHEVVINIQCSGGFRHSGFIVVCEGDDPNFIPQVGRDWTITKLAQSVFEYRE